MEGRPLGVSLLRHPLRVLRVGCEGFADCRHFYDEPARPRTCNLRITRCALACILRLDQIERLAVFAGAFFIRSA